MLEFACHGKECSAKVKQSSAWVPALTTLRKVVGHNPTVKDLAAHVHCARCASHGRKAGLRFYLHDATVKELEARRLRATEKAKEHFAHYLR